MQVSRRASFCPRTLPDHADASRPPALVLLDKRAYISKRENATTAWAASSGGDTVKVSFCLADPPSLSYTCVHCPDLEGSRQNGGFSCEPFVAAAEGAFVLLLVRFNFGPRTFFYDSGIRDYFVYRAGPGKPSLGCLPRFIEHDIRSCVGILPCSDDNMDFVVAALVPLLDPLDRPGLPFDLHLFSSRTWEWRTVVPRLDPSCEHNSRVLSHETDKVIVVGGGVMAWVDLWRGILLCDVLADDPVVILVPLPKPTVAKVWKSCLPLIRDVTSDGHNSLSFVEVQLPNSRSNDLPPSQFDIFLSESDAEYDSGATAGLSYVSDGWRATTWKRTLFSCADHWIKDCTVDYSDVLGVDVPCCPLLPHEQMAAAKAGPRTLKSLNGCYAPVLSMHDDSVVYMMSSLNSTHDDREALVAAFDVRKSTLKALAPFSAERSFGDICIPCSFSKYLITT